MRPLVRVLAFAVFLLSAAQRTPSTPARPSFTDIAPQSKFSYVTNNGFTGRKYFPQPLCGGVAVLDYDNDGYMDLFFTNGASLPEGKKSDRSHFHALLRNTGGKRFEDVTDRAGVAGEDLGFSYGVAAGDFDNDGWTDLFIANTGPNTLYRNRGDGTFANVSKDSGLDVKPKDTLSVQGAWFDYDNDGLLDLVVSNYTLWTAEKDQRCVREGRDYYCHPSTYVNVPNRLYRNRGNGRFDDVTGASGFGKSTGKGMGIAIADYDANGWTDVFIANDTEANQLYLNHGNGTFKEAALLHGVAYNDSGSTVSAMGADARDYDNDGRVDIFYNNLMGQIWGLFRNAGSKSFRYVSAETKIAQLSAPLSGWSAGFIDYNNDGWKDLYSANGDVDDLASNARQHDTIFENVEGKSFLDVSKEMGTDFLRTGFQRGAAFVDFDNDGFQDIAVTSLNERPRILRNSGNGNHWLLIRAEGRKSNRDAVGTRISITTGSGRTLHNHVSPSVGLLSSSDPRVHFGFGRETVVKVEIRWPSGAHQSIENVRANQILTVKEPANP
jgi:hypothetical protein